MIDKVLNQPEIQQEPPILIDIGASGKIHKSWKSIAKYSICIAFDADDRDFGHVKEESKNFKKLYIYNCIVSDKKTSESDFYLTKSPHCSSLLAPDPDSLQDWSFAPLFNVDRIAKIRTIDLPSVLKELNIQKVDWFKSDSQGIDLRLFKSLGDELTKNILVAEFEPGLMDAYKGEDKLHSILCHMENTKKFWLSDLVIKGSQRISENRLNNVFRSLPLRKLFNAVGKTSPGWGEMTYINNFKDENLSKRDFLLGWVFSSIQQQNGFAYEIAENGYEIFQEDLFKEMSQYSKSKLKKEFISFSYIPLAYKKVLRETGIG
ncbi:methyltransferase, FkbM family [Pseudarcicella hirudinis]|uniref:Methyltransferase, FkbM family n=1 Tax=Pseudarcicella hirudinis TaxID=1079859 RepID=A0A1I5VDB9_9BACT|nr:methyltransferase, FkbM family [Pseudarcicella hirudinis]